MERFGRVYIEKRINGLKQLILIPSVRFSNLDHKWYDADRKLHSEFERNRGKEFTLRFQIEQTDKDGHLVPFEGNIKLLYKLGEVERQDFENIIKAENEDLERVQRYNIKPKEVTVENSRGGLEHAGFLAACFPGCKLSNYKLLRIFSLAFFQFDDDMENLPAAVKYDHHKSFLKLSIDIFDKSINLDAQICNERKIPDVLWQYLKYIQHFNDELSNVEGDTGRGIYVRETFKEYLQGVCMENSGEWKEQRKSFSAKAQEELRLVVGAAFLCLEMAMFDAEIQIKPEIRNTFLFKWFVRLYAQQTCWINDIVSYKKEVESGYSGEGCNKVNLLHLNKGLPLKDAMQKALDKINEHKSSIEETGKLLIELYTNDESVKRFVSKTKDIIYGHIQWLTFSDRYHKDMVFDCVLLEQQ